MFKKLPRRNFLLNPLLNTALPLYQLLFKLGIFSALQFPKWLMSRVLMAIKAGNCVSATASLPDMPVPRQISPM